ncbi:chromosomal replication initiator protein DnaA [Spiroplasma endosymbiont of Crioceris asparagi]|uniref:chromosomal replication initiator protein DnaA n=1 Tax=Spiroplasma endosymbiont of Crioceris asparagi TaxID=3066286 RepID=UPI0030CECED1
MNADNILKNLKNWMQTSDIIDPSFYNDYLNKISLKIADNKVYLLFKNELPKLYLSSEEKNIKDMIKKFANADVSVIFMLETEFNSNIKIIKEKETKKKQIKNKDYSFTNFIKGKSNSAAYDASKTVVKNPGQWNPLFIYGNSGLGKTHLLNAIAKEFGENDNNLKIKCYPSTEFRKEIIRTLQNKDKKIFDEIEKLKDSFLEYDVLLIDDIQFLAKNEKTNEIFFNVFNKFIEEEKQIVLTSDKFPENLSGFDKRLISRFNSGLSVKVDEPDEETLYNIVSFKAENSNLRLSEALKKHIAAEYKGDVRKIEGIINRIDFWNIQKNNLDNNNEIDIEDLLIILEDYTMKINGEITPLKIKEVVAEHYGIDVKALEGQTRISKIAHARHVAMFLIHDMLNKTTTEVGLFFSNRDHTTVISANKKIQDKMKNKAFKAEMNKIKQKIKKS